MCCVGTNRHLATAVPRRAVAQLVMKLCRSKPSPQTGILPNQGQSEIFLKRGVLQVIRKKMRTMNPPQHCDCCAFHQVAKSDHNTTPSLMSLLRGVKRQLQLHCPSNATFADEVFTRDGLTTRYRGIVGGFPCSWAHGRPMTTIRYRRLSMAAGPSTSLKERTSPVPRKSPVSSSRNHGSSGASIRWML